MRASIKRFILSAVLAATASVPSIAVARIWITTSGSWANAGNWNSNFSPGVDDFSAVDLGEDASVFLNGNQTSRALAFGDAVPSHNWILVPGVPANSTLTLDPISGEPIIDVLNQTTTFRIVVAGTEGLTKTGLGTLVLAQPNTYSGTTVVRSGTLALDFSAAEVASDLVPGELELRLGSLTASAAGGTIKLIGDPGASNSQTFGGTTLLFGQNGVAIDQNDAANVNLFLGFFDRDLGSVANFTLPASGNVNAVSATIPNINGILGGWATIGSGPIATWAANDGAGNIVPYSMFTEITGAPLIANNPAANVRFSNSTGDATVSAGTTDINTLLFTDPAHRTVATPAGGTLRLGVSGGIFKTDTSVGEDDSQLTIGLPGSFLTAGGAPNSVGELILNSNANGADQNGIVVNSSITNNGLAPVYVVKSGNAAAVFTSTNTYSGGTYITSGQLKASASSGFGTGPVHAATGTQVLLAGGTHANDIFISGRGLPQPNEGALRFEGAGAEARGKITLLEDTLIVSSVSTGDALIAGQISGQHDVEFRGPMNGVITLANSTNNWSGNTTIGPGTLRIGAGEVIPHGIGRGDVVMHGDLTSALPSVLDLNGRTETINGLSSTGDAGKIVIRSDSPGPAVLRIGNEVDNDFHFAGAIQDGAGTVGITKVGGRTLTLFGTSTYSGPTTFAGGVLRLGSASTLPTGTALVGQGGQLDLNGFDATIASLNGSGAIYSNSSVTPSVITLTGGVNVYSGSISSFVSAGLQPVGLTIMDGLLTLRGPNFYTGPTTLHGGTLSITGHLDSTGTVTVNSGATLSGAGIAPNGRVGHVTMQQGSRLRAGVAADDGSIGTLSMSSLTVNGGDMRFDLSTGGTSDRVNVIGIATFTAPSTITPATVTPGLYTLLTADTLRGVAPTLNVPPATRASFALNFETLADRIGLIIAGSPPKAITWTGVNGSEWDINTTANWSIGAVAEQYFNLDSVTFADGPSNRDIVLNTAVFPSSVTVNNSAGNDYAITGTGGIGESGFGNGTTMTKTGTGTLTLGGVNTYAGNTTVNQGLLRISGSLTNRSAVNVAVGARFVVEGTASVGQVSGMGSTTVGNGATPARLVADYVRQSLLTIEADSEVVTNRDGGTSVFNALSIAGGETPVATLDLDNNSAIIDHTGASPAATVRQQILAGRGGPGLGATWTGEGITSSVAAAAVATDPESRSVGYAENSSLPLGPYANFRGQAVDDTSVLMAYTRTGDANLDGIVDDTDVTILGATYAPGVPQPHWALGDFDFNGFVDDADVTLLGVFYDPSAPPLVAPGPAEAIGVAAVPEPGTAAIVLGGLGVLLLRKAMRRKPGKG